MKQTIYIFLLLFPLAGISQNTFQPKQVDMNLRGITYRSEWAVDLRLHSNGFAIAYNSGKSKTYDKVNYIQFEIGFMKDRREKNQNKNLAISGVGQSSSFAFGKANHMFVLRGGWGKRKYLSEKARRKGLAVGYTYELGPSVALLKPYHLELQYPAEVDGTITTEIRNERLTGDNRNKFLNYNDIYGGGGFFRGLKNLSFTPGVQGKVGALFSMGAYDKYVKAIEAGLMFDVYPRKIAIMAETGEVSNKPYFVNFYVNIHLGKRKN